MNNFFTFIMTFFVYIKLSITFFFILLPKGSDNDSNSCDYTIDSVEPPV